MPEQNLGRVVPVHKGEWSSSTNYTKLDIVSWRGSSYFCIADNTDREIYDNNFWRTMAVKGTNGTNGTDGARGARGDIGFTGATGSPGSVQVLPVGAIIIVASVAAPTGFLKCDGGTLTSSYQDLINVLGSNTLPNYQDKFLRGSSATRAINTVQNDSFKSHKHLQGAEIQGDIAIFGTENRTDSGDGYLDHNYGNTNIYPYTSSEGGAETRPINVSVDFYIKY